MHNKSENNASTFKKYSKPLSIVFSILIFIAISWIYFYPNDVHGDVMQQGDVMQGMANGQEGKLYSAENNGEVSRWTNALFGGMPTFQISPSYDSSNLLKWIDNIYSLRILGFPEPVSWLFMLMLGFFILLMAFKMKWYYAVLGAIGYAFSTYFIIIIGAGHIWKLLALAYVPPTIAGIVWCYRGKYLAGAAVTALFGSLQLMWNHPQMSYYFGFVIVALIIAFLCKALKEKKIKQWLIATAAVAVAGGLALVANAPNLYLSTKYAKETMRGGHSELTLNDKDKKAQAANDGLDKEYITHWSYGIDETFTLLVPNVKGGASMKPGKSENDPSQIVNNGVTLDKTQAYNKLFSEGKFGPIDDQALAFFTQYFGDQPGTNGPVYVGALFFALFILGCIVVKGPIKWALLIVTILAILLSWGHNMMWFSDLFIDHFPLYNKFRTVSSILVIAEFTIPLLAVLAVHKMFTEEDFFKKHSLALYISFGACAALCLLFALFPSIFSNFSDTDKQTLDMINQQVGNSEVTQSLKPNIDAIRMSLVSSDAWRSLIFIILGFGVIYAYLKGWFKANPMVITLILAAVALIDLYTVNKRYVDQNSFISKLDINTTKFEERPVDKTILQDTAMNYRVLDAPGFMSPNSSYFHKTVGGYHAAKLTRYNDLIENQLIKNGQLNLDNQSVFNMLNTKYIIYDDQHCQPNPGALGNAWFVDTLTYVKDANAEMRFLDKFDAARAAVAEAKFQKQLGTATPKEAGDTIFETSYKPNLLTYHSHSAGDRVAVFSEIYFPWGWKATVDGKEVPIGRVNYVLRAIQVPAGDHSITFSFDPDEVHSSDGAAKVAIIAIFLLAAAAIALPLIRRRKQAKPETQN